MFASYLNVSIYGSYRLLLGVILDEGKYFSFLENIADFLEYGLNTLIFI